LSLPDARQVVASAVTDDLEATEPDIRAKARSGMLIALA
jgi:hypothetical protein